jgi:uncharacterized protein YneF (UPF0154 family)
MIAWWWLLLVIPLAFLAGVIVGSGLMLFDLKALHDYFYELATEQPDLNRASRERPRNSINNQKQKNDEDGEQVVHLFSKKAQI